MTLFKDKYKNYFLVDGEAKYTLEMLLLMRFLLKSNIINSREGILHLI